MGKEDGDNRVIDESVSTLFPEGCQRFLLSQSLLRNKQDLNIHWTYVLTFWLPWGRSKFSIAQSVSSHNKYSSKMRNPLIGLLTWLWVWQVKYVLKFLSQWSLIALEFYSIFTHYIMTIFNTPPICKSIYLHF